MSDKSGKNIFYKYLNLDSETRSILKWYKKTVEDLKNDKYDKELEDDLEI